MKRRRASWKVRLLLLFTSVACLLLLLVGIDAIVGRLVPAVPLIFPPHSEVHYETSEYSYHVRINSMGFRDREVDPQRRAATRILAIGDSFTYGWGVELEASWPKVVERLARAAGHDVEVLNLGAPGSGPHAYARVARRAIPRLKPDLVLVGVLQGDDLEQAASEAGAPAAAWDIERVLPNLTSLVRKRQPLSRLEAGDVRALSRETAGHVRASLNEEQRGRLAALDADIREAFDSGDLNPALIALALKDPDYFSRVLRLDDPRMQAGVRELSAQLSEIRELGDEAGASVLVLSTPYGAYTSARNRASLARMGFTTDDAMATSDAPDATIRTAAERAALPFFSATAAFRAADASFAEAGVASGGAAEAARGATPLYLRLDGHFTPAGHALFAELVLAAASPHLVR